MAIMETNPVPHSVKVKQFLSIERMRGRTSWLLIRTQMKMNLESMLGIELRWSDVDNSEALYASLRAFFPTADVRLCSHTNLSSNNVVSLAMRIWRGQKEDARRPTLELMRCQNVV